MESRIVELPNLPDHGDPYDWIEAGHTLTELLEICERTPAFQAPVESNSDQDSKTEPETDDSGRGPSKALLLVRLASKATLFHYPAGRTYARVPAGDHVETLAIGSKAFKRWLAAEFWKNYEASVAPNAFQEAIATLDGRAAYDGQCHDVHLRLAEFEGNIYLDMCDAAWRVIEISADGWRVIPARDCPVRFRRSEGMLPLPEPKTGGSLDDLRTILGFKQDDIWANTMAWLI
jgi:hypothetical protein